ncbi:MAG: glycosyltransferase family 4 protein [Gammaproteobacteria bacterium]
MILIATQCFAPDVGGIESLMTGLAGALNRRGHNLVVFADRRRDTARPEPAFPWPVKRFGGPRPWRRRAKARSIHRLLRRAEVTHIICDSWKSLESLSPPAGLPVLCLVHGMEIPQNPSAGKRRRIETSLAKAATVVANSRYTADRVQPFLAENVFPRVIYPGVDAPDTPGEAVARKTEQRLAMYRPLLVSVARLERHKGQDRVLQCLPGLLPDFPGLGYVCLGEGPARASLESLARKLGIADRVLMLGSADAETRGAVLSQSDLFVLPGRGEGDRVEGFGIAFIEAAWQGLPAVAGATGGGAEAVEHGVTGLVCRGEDADAVCTAIRELLSNDDSRRQLGKNAKERARRFSWDETVRRYETLLGLSDTD